MATKTIDHMDFYVAIAGYQLPSVPDQTFNSLRVSVGYRKGSGFYASFHPGWGDERWWGCLLDVGDTNPLTGGMTVEVDPATKNNAKRIAEMTESLKMAKDIIAALFDDREWQKLKAVLQNVAKFGYTEGFKEQAEKYLAERVSKRYEKAVKPIESESNEKENENQNEKVMAQNVKAADLIGKVIIVGNNQATIVIKSVDGDKLSGEFSKDGKTTPMSFPVSQLHGMTEKGLWKMDDGGCKMDDVKPQTSEVTTEADVQEVQDIVPVVTPKKSDGGSKTADVPQTSNKPAAIVKPIGKKSDVRGKKEDVHQPSAIKHQPSKGKYVYSTYQTSKGKTGAKITGVSETDAAYQQAAAIHASGSYTKDKDGNKHFYLCFGPRYAEAAKKVCELLNAGKPIEDAIAVVNAATEERAVKREEARAKREERKTQPSNISPQTSTEKTYTQTELAEWLRKLNAGDPKAAKFFNDLAKAA